MLSPISFSFQIVSEFIDIFVKFSNFMSVTRGGFLYKMIVPGGGFLLPSSRVLGGMVMDEIDTCINRRHKQMQLYLTQD